MRHHFFGRLYTPHYYSLLWQERTHTTSVQCDSSTLLIVFYHFSRFFLPYVTFLDISIHGDIVHNLEPELDYTRSTHPLNVVTYAVISILSSLLFDNPPHDLFFVIMFPNPSFPPLMHPGSHTTILTMRRTGRCGAMRWTFKENFI